MIADAFEVTHPKYGILQCSTYQCEGRLSSLSGVPLLGIAGTGYGTARVRVWIVAHTLPFWLEKLETIPRPITLGRISDTEPFICLVSITEGKPPQFMACFPSHEAALRQR